MTGEVIDGKSQPAFFLVTLANEAGDRRSGVLCRRASKWTWKSATFAGQLVEPDFLNQIYESIILSKTVE
jgi:hypothetical protein